jgi:ATP phosphoribosyltransferase regulatory subunit HisZ
MPHATPKPDWLVVATTHAATANALVYGQKLRSAAALVRVEMYLHNGEVEQVRQIAIGRNIAQIAWVSVDGVSVEKIIN